MDFIESIKGMDFAKFGLFGSIIGGLFFVVIKALMMIDRYNNKLFDIIEDKQDNNNESIEMPKSWTERNRLEK